MGKNPYLQVGPRVPVRQTEQAMEGQVRNDAGGFVFQVDPWTSAKRFLILGSEGGTYYASERKVTKENAQVIVKLANDPETGPKLVELIRDISWKGRAPKQDPAILALAICASSSDQPTRLAAFKALNQVCRIGTHLFMFTTFLIQFRGTGGSRAQREAIAHWYLDRSVDNLALQVVKYRSRSVPGQDPWSHRDIMRHFRPPMGRGTATQKSVLDWVVHNNEGEVRSIPMIDAYLTAKTTTDPKVWTRLAAEGLPWEALPDEALKLASVWEAMLPKMGLTALLRNLGRLTRLGVIAPMSANNAVIMARLTDPEGIKRGRVHPLAILTALMVYKGGHSLKGTDYWQPVPQIIGALDEAFYLGFGEIVPAGKRTLVAMDVSGSMAGSRIANSPLHAREAAGALAMTIVRTEPAYHTLGFGQGLFQIPLTPHQRLDDVIRTISGLPWQSTDCALPMMWAAHNRVPVDTFVVITDNETWAGRIHPYQALAEYQQKMSIPARLAVIGTEARPFSIANPADPGMMDMVGFDTDTPEILSSFSRGEI